MEFVMCDVTEAADKLKDLVLPYFTKTLADLR